MLLDNEYSERGFKFFSGMRESRSSGDGINMLEGEPTSIVAHIMAEEDKVRRFCFSNGDLEISWGSGWGKTFHTAPFHEIELSESLPESLIREVADQCIAATAREGLLGNIDKVLDDFSEYVPSLRK